MNQDLATILTLRRVLTRAGEGGGVAGALVAEMARGNRTSKQVARSILLGNPVPVSVEPLKGGSSEVSMLAQLISTASSSSAKLVGSAGGDLAAIFERWTKAKENSRLEGQVQRFRGVIVSGVLGAVMAMIASIGPVVGSLNFLGSGEPSGGSYVLAAGAMAGVSSAMLGLFVSGKGWPLHLVATIVAFGAVSFLVSPLTSVPVVPLWGIK